MVRQPFKTAFIPEVPDASCGRTGLFSQTSAPEHSTRAIDMS